MNMKTVRVAIEESVVQEFEITVDNDEDSAIDIAIQKYNAGELVLEPGEIQFRQIAAVEPYSTEWVEF